MAAPAPAVAGTMEAAIASRAWRGHEGGGSVRHALTALQPPCRLQSSPHKQKIEARAVGGVASGRRASVPRPPPHRSGDDRPATLTTPPQEVVTMTRSSP